MEDANSHLHITNEDAAIYHAVNIVIKLRKHLIEEDKYFESEILIGFNTSQVSTEVS